MFQKVKRGNQEGHSPPYSALAFWYYLLISLLFLLSIFTARLPKITWNIPVEEVVHFGKIVL